MSNLIIIAATGILLAFALALVFSVDYRGTDPEEAHEDHRETEDTPQPGHAGNTETEEVPLTAYLDSLKAGHSGEAESDREQESAEDTESEEGEEDACGFYLIGDRKKKRNEGL